MAEDIFEFVIQKKVFFHCSLNFVINLILHRQITYLISIFFLKTIEAFGSLNTWQFLQNLHDIYLRRNLGSIRFAFNLTLQKLFFCHFFWICNRILEFIIMLCYLRFVDSYVQYFIISFTFHQHKWLFFTCSMLLFLIFCYYHFHPCFVICLPQYICSTCALSLLVLEVHNFWSFSIHCF